MAADILARLLKSVLAKTRAERIYAFDCDGTLVEYAVLDPNAPAEPEITDFMRGLISRALQSQELVLSNNTFTDPQQAPNTNTNIHNLRVYVVIPAHDIGVLFIDQAIRAGIIPRPILDEIAGALKNVADSPNPNALTDEELATLFDAVS
jgi:hypothetical protein